MRRFILIAAMVLLSASAQADVSRGLTLASSEEPVVAEQLKTVDTPKVVEVPKTVERPAIVDTTTGQPKVDSPKPAPDNNAQKPKYTRESTEARVIYELHRHGIYW
jgi:hypothetical protein